VLRTDELRRKIEQLPSRSHEEWGYYERWSAAIAGLLQEKGVLAPGELEAAVWGESFGGAAGVDRPGQARFAPGDSVIVRREDPARPAWRAPHLRTPGYIFGVPGIVERYCGVFGDPSLLAYGISHGPPEHLYRVRFLQADVWPEATAPTGHAIDLISDLNLPADSVDVEVCQLGLGEIGPFYSDPSGLQAAPTSRGSLSARPCLFWPFCTRRCRGQLCQWRPCS
jgi:nitrile hydratase